MSAFPFAIITNILIWVVVGRVIAALLRSARESQNRQTQNRAGSSIQRATERTQARAQRSVKADSQWNTQGRNLANAAKSYKPKSPAKTESSQNDMFTNHGYDDYTKLSKPTAGYNGALSHNSAKMRESRAKQYSHTYNGHEPWDNCVPKELDPWDKNFDPDN